MHDQLDQPGGQVIAHPGRRTQHGDAPVEYGRVEPVAQVAAGLVPCPADRIETRPLLPAGAVADRHRQIRVEVGVGDWNQGEEVTGGVPVGRLGGSIQVARHQGHRPRQVGGEFADRHPIEGGGFFPPLRQAFDVEQAAGGVGRPQEGGGIGHHDGPCPSTAPRSTRRGPRVESTSSKGAPGTISTVPRRAGGAASSPARRAR